MRTLCPYASFSFLISPDKVAAFKVAEQQELDAMRDLRQKNIEHYQEEGLTGKYCLCQRPPAGLMLQCELCKDWFHSKFITSLCSDRCIVKFVFRDHP